MNKEISDEIVRKAAEAILKHKGYSLDRVTQFPDYYEQPLRMATLEARAALEAAGWAEMATERRYLQELAESHRRTAEKCFSEKLIAEGQLATAQAECAALKRNIRLALDASLDYGDRSEAESVAYMRDRLQAEYERLRALYEQEQDDLRHATETVSKLQDERDAARAALAVCEEKFDAIYSNMGGDDRDGWESPEDCWQLALDGRTEARRVLGGEEGA